MILMAIAAMMVLTASSQVTITKFKFCRDQPFGMFPGRKMIDMKFKNTSDRAFKYLKVYYYAVNAVGDVVDFFDPKEQTVPVMKVQFTCPCCGRLYDIEIKEHPLPGGNQGESEELPFKG